MSLARRTIPQSIANTSPDAVIPKLVVGKTLLLKISTIDKTYATTVTYQRMANKNGSELTSNKLCKRLQKRADALTVSSIN
jgi:hypothetical protein